MLARQGWRLLMAPESLCAQVLEAKYFPDGNILTASQWTDQYFIVMEKHFEGAWGIKALKEGLIWRVGSGENINIWLDPWIPFGVTRRPITPRSRNIILRVSELIDPITSNWDVQLVQDIFWEEDARHILAIPVRTWMDDFLAWHYDEKGVFSVKSVYHVLEDDRCRQSKAPSCRVLLNSKWSRNLWLEQDMET